MTREEKRVFIFKTFGDDFLCSPRPEFEGKSLAELMDEPGMLGEWITDVVWRILSRIRGELEVY